GEEIAGSLDVGPVAYLKCNMMNRGLGVAQEIHGVMIAAATQEGEEIASPIRDAETEHVTIELHHAGDVRALIGDVAELERHHTREIVVVLREGRVPEDFQCSALRILEGQRLANARRDIVPPLAFDASFVQSRGDLGKIAAGCDLE